MSTITTKNLALYFSPYCPYCHRVLDAMVQLELHPDLAAGNASGITLKNTSSDGEAARELKEGGGKKTVPCLRIERDGEVEWMYESLDIIAFLQQTLASD